MRSATVRTPPCGACPGQHWLYRCRVFRHMGEAERLRTVARQGCCGNCLHGGHHTSSCPSTTRCRMCKEKHHSLLHPPSSVRTAEHNRNGRRALSSRSAHLEIGAAHVSGVVPSAGRTRRRRGSRRNPSSAPNHLLPHSPYVTSSSAVVNHSSLRVDLPLRHLITIKPTCVVQLLLPGLTVPVRAILDSAGRGSLVCSPLVRGLNLPTASTGHGRLCRMTIASSRDLSRRITLSADVGDMTRASTPEESIPQHAVDHFEGFPLADPVFNHPAGVALVFGPEVLPEILRPRQDFHGALMAQLTIFGWVISGAYH